MSLCDAGFDSVQPKIVAIKIGDRHPLFRLAQKIPWNEFKDLIWNDLQNTTEKHHWWRGRPLSVRIHLGVYLLQQLLNLSDRDTEKHLRDNAAFQVFCGHGLVPNWHVPDHTSIEDFRSRLSPETQRQLANAVAKLAARLGYAVPAHIDVDSTVQEANLTYPAQSILLIKLIQIAQRVWKWIQNCRPSSDKPYFGRVRSIAQCYFNAQRKKNEKRVIFYKKQLWNEVMTCVTHVLNRSGVLNPLLQQPRFWFMQQAIERLNWMGMRYLDDLYRQWFEHEAFQAPLTAFHLREVHCFNKMKLPARLQFGRAYQLGRIEGNFVWVGSCTSLHMPDAESLIPLLREHHRVFETPIKSLAADAGYYSLKNVRYLDQQSVDAPYIRRPYRVLNAPPERLDPQTRAVLSCRRQGVEGLIGQLKRGWQMGRSRMRSDRTTLSSGYASVLGFNLKQMMNYAAVA